MKRTPLFALAISLVGAHVGSTAVADDRIRAASQNQYLGADLNPVILAPPGEFAQEIQKAFAQIAANDFPARAEVLVEEICAKRPALVGLQEVFNFQVAFGGGELMNPGPPFVDHLAETMAQIDLQCGNYAVAALVTNIQIGPFPFDVNGDQVPELVKVTDRDVILARSDVATVKLDGLLGAICPNVEVIPDLPLKPSDDGCNYGLVAVVPDTPIGPIVIERGFVVVDAVVGNKTVRFVNTHLETMNPEPLVQAVQATELNVVLGVLAMPPPPLPPVPAPEELIVVGDINSSPEDSLFTSELFPGPELVPPYMQFAQGLSFVFPLPVGLAYHDAWDLRPGKPPGFTCCELSDLSNPTTLDDERIDVIFSLGRPTAVKANVVGNEPSNKTTPSRLWPSDHAAVFGELRF